jgi:acetolactate synthase-1/2/3 large subunit/5-guanidino-2-oxopentanoate decarboxylase
LVDLAFTEFEFGVRRPKVIQCPISRLGAGAAGFPPGGWPETGLPSPGKGPMADLAIWLQGARRPLFIFGGGARCVDFVGPALERWGAASMATSAGLGIVPPGDPLHFGGCLARPGSESVVSSADLVIAVGTELSEVDLWRDTFGKPARLAQINTDAATLHRVADRVTAQHLMIAGDCLSGLEMLMEAVGETLETDWTPAEVAATRARWRAEISTERPGIVPVCDALSAALPANTMIFSDMTQFAYAALEVWDLAHPGLWHHPSGFGTLGYALPAAIGGALGHDGPVLAIAGDYGFQYTMQEMGTAVELGLSLPILLWDNGKLGEIEEAMVASQIATNAVVARNPDFLALARAYGAAAEEPATLGALQAAVTTALTAGRPTLIRMTAALAD